MFATLNAALNRQREEVGRGTVESWAEQIHKKAQQTTYGSRPGAGGGQIQLGAAYERLADPLIRTELEKPARGRPS